MSKYSNWEVVGIEIGSDAIRGIVLDARTSEVVAAAEADLNNTGSFNRWGLVEGSVCVEALAEVVHRLGFSKSAQVNTAVTVGASYCGVGSGPDLLDWLDRLALSLNQRVIYAGGVGKAFAPVDLVEAVAKLGIDAGFEIQRVDLAPVAAARVLGAEAEAEILLGSGCGWRARRRSGEVLEATEASEIGKFEPLQIVQDGDRRTVDHYEGVKVADLLTDNYHLDLGQLSVAVGAAMGIVSGCAANLLEGSSTASQLGRGTSPGHRGPPPPGVARDVTGVDTGSFSPAIANGSSPNGALNGASVPTPTPSGRTLRAKKPEPVGQLSDSSPQPAERLAPAPAQTAEKPADIVLPEPTIELREVRRGLDPPEEAASVPAPTRARRLETPVPPPVQPGRKRAASRPIPPTRKPVEEVSSVSPARRPQARREPLRTRNHVSDDPINLFSPDPHQEARLEDDSRLGSIALAFVALLIIAAIFYFAIT